MSSREYEGPALDATGQHISEAPYWQSEGETVDIIDDRLDGVGEERIENVPTPKTPTTPPEAKGQTTFDDWDWRGSE